MHRFRNAERAFREIDVAGEVTHPHLIAKHDTSFKQAIFWRIDEAILVNRKKPNLGRRRKPL
ncbi:hypothetical protein UB46_01910 [Burkholderiaceae bacterium 16]|nr:hypothetical protein UB46_01910 [Burkholderiaceae bacterium 16]